MFKRSYVHKIWARKRYTKSECFSPIGRENKERLFFFFSSIFPPSLLSFLPSSLPFFLLPSFLPPSLLFFLLPSFFFYTQSSIFKVLFIEQVPLSELKMSIKILRKE